MSSTRRRRVSVIVPARNESAMIGRTVGAVLGQRRPENVDLELLVVDDGSVDATGEIAARAGATVLRLERRQGGGNPARARNAGAAAATGDPLVFLDADCVPQPEWLATLLAAHDRGAAVVGGAMDLPPGLPVTARCDYYSGWYHVHGRRPAGPVTQHPPGNLSVRAAVFRATAGFREAQPVAYAHEELAWQAQAQRLHGPIAFEPRAVVHHHNRPSVRALLRRNYRWGYSAIDSKAGATNVRWPWLYRRPRLLAAAAVPLALASTPYVIAQWLRAGVVEPLLVLPGVLAARLAYGIGMAAGGSRASDGAERRPRWE